MNLSYQDAWHQAMQMVKENVNEIVFSGFYRDLDLLDVIDHTFYIGTSNEVVYTTLKEKQSFGTPLADALRELVDNRVELRFFRADEAKAYLLEKNEKEKSAVSLHSSANWPEAKPALEVLDGYCLHPDFTFSTFVIGKNNEHCSAFCRAIADDMAKDLDCSKSINPLFIYGNSGLGKTHLISAIAYQILQAQPSAKIKFTTCENFVNEYIASISNNQTEAFRNKYRNVDLLLIDDIQFLTGKEGTQEEFFHTFEALRNKNRQIIITSDKMPRDIPDLEERLVTRFEGGVLTDIQVPNLETRIAILQKKAEMENVQVDNQVIEYIVNNVGDNIRTLQGALQNVMFTARINNQPITLNLAETVIKNKIQHQRQITADLVLSVVGEFYGLSRDKMMGTSRKKQILIPRQISMYLCRDMLGMSLPSIGKLFNKDHSTVSNAIDKIEESLANDISLQNDLRNIKRNLEN